jgi:acyl-coenzyme A thioesterase PaaI-like protein
LATVERAGQRRLDIAAPGGPERFFRVARPTAAGEVVSSSMPAGPWLTGPSGRPLAGALGVLIDNVAGYVLLLRRPPGEWSVSAEITLDLLLPVPADGSVLRAEGSVRHADLAGGFSSASVTDDSGRLLAVCTQHGRWVRGASMAQDGSAPDRGVPPAADLAGFLGGQARAMEGGALLELTVAPELANPLGNLHGASRCAPATSWRRPPSRPSGDRGGRRPSTWPTRAPSRSAPGCGSRLRWPTWAGPSASSGSPHSATAASRARSPR